MEHTYAVICNEICLRWRSSPQRNFLLLNFIRFATYYFYCNTVL